MGWFDAIKFCFGATITYCQAGAKSCPLSGLDFLMLDKFSVLNFDTWHAILCLLNFCCPLQHDAACRVIARLKKERDEARALLAQAERQIPMSVATPDTANAAALSNGKRGF